MSQLDQEKKAKKDALKKLRTERKDLIKQAAARMKAQKKEIKAIKEQMKNGPGTVPVIAKTTGIPSDRVLWYIAALKKYGQIMEGEKDGDYYTYVLPDASEITDEDPEVSLETA